MKRTRLFCVILLVLIAGVGSLAAPQQPQHQQPIFGDNGARLRPGMQPEDVQDPSEIGYWCTSIPVDKEASADGSCMTSHSCDGHYEIRVHIVAGGKHPKGAMRPVMKGGGVGADRPPAKQVGEIPEVETTFTRYDSAYPFMNEKQVEIGETTIGGRRELYNDEGWFDIMELERVALERASTARECVRIMGELAEKFGYGDSGECLTVIDPNEAWHFEIFGAGPAEKGAVWAAVRIPAGHVGVSANRPRIPELHLEDKDHYMASASVTTVAEKMGWWKKGEPFDFHKAYGGRGGLGSTRREWRVLSTFAPSLHLDPWDPEPPFTVKAEKKITIQDLMALHRDSYQSTEFDASTGAPSGPFGNPNRPQAGAAPPQGFMGFERTISVIQCSYTVVLQARGNMPSWIGGVAWFTPDDAKTGNFIPFYAGNTQLPQAFDIGNRAELDRKSAWWAFDFVGNWAQLRFNAMIEDIKAKRAELEGKFLADQAEIEKQAVDLYKKDPAGARKFINDYSNKVAQQTVDEWWKLSDLLIVKYNDNSVNVPGGQRPPGASKEWLDSIGFGTKKIPTKPTGPTGPGGPTRPGDRP
jgi:dipeptidase